MIRKQYKFLMIYIVLILLTFTGCWDYKDINNKIIVLAVGVDYENGKYMFTSENTLLQKGSIQSEKGSEQNRMYYFSAEGEDFEAVRSKINAKKTQENFLGAVRVVDFSKNFAKEGIETYINRVNKLYGYRRTVLIVINSGRAQDIVKANIQSDISVGFAIENMIQQLAEEGTTIYKKIQNITSDIAVKDIGYVVPYISREADLITYEGLAIMKDSKLVDTIKDEDCKGVMYIIGDKVKKTYNIKSLDNDKNKIAYNLRLKKRKISTDYEDEKVLINIELALDAQIEYQYYLRPISEEQIKKYENILSEQIKKEIMNIIKKSQDEYSCDFFGFAKYFRADNYSVYKKIDWKEKYPLAEFNVEVKTRIINQNQVDPNAKLRY